MNYYINAKTALDLESTTQFITQELQKEGFGVVTQFDVNQAFKEKLGIDFRAYRILGACNPSFALRSINTEDKIGTILPCNVMLQQINEGTEVAIINPISMVSGIENEEMKAIAREIYEKMNRVINSLS